jgi:outer membrane protein assembly factor BamB
MTPLWLQPATLGGDLSGVVISQDQSTIISGGGQLIDLSRNGEKRWTAWGSTLLDVSGDGNYILTGQGRVVRLISGTGTFLWEQPLDSVITDVSLAPDASVIAAAAGGGIRTFSLSGKMIASNTTMAINRIRVTPSGKQILITTSRGVFLADPGIRTLWSDMNATQDLVDVTRDGSSFVTLTNDRVRKYNASGSLVWDTKVPGGNALALALSGDGSTVVLGMDDNNVRVLDRDGTLLWTANATNWITSVAVSDGGNTIVAGSRDKKVHVFNRAGTRLGIFSAKSPIDPHSVAVTRDGSLIVVVDQTAVYGFSRSALIPQETPVETVTASSPGTPVGTTPALPTVTTARRVTPKILTLSNPRPLPSETPESPMPPVVPLTALGIFIFWRLRKT